MFKDKFIFLSIPNEIIIGNNFYRIIKSFSNILNNYNFINNGELKVTENIGYPTYNIIRKNTLIHNDILTINSSIEKQLHSLKEKPIENKNKTSFFSNKKTNSKKIILVDDEYYILFTYESFLKGYDYDIISFTDS